jgi:TatD DNase family protein
MTAHVSPGPGFLDTHAHLDDRRFASDLDACLGRAQAAGVLTIITVGTDLASSEAALALAGRCPQIYAAVGIHPHEAASVQPADFRRLGELAREPKVVAVGETGLDFYRDLAPRPVAEALFRQHLELALSADLPVIIHSRQAHDAVLDILESRPHRASGRPHRPTGVLHSFDGPLATARRALDLGLCISFTGVLTYPNAEGLRQVASQLPLDRILLETDCPYLAPQPYRGKRNEPAYVVAVAETLAQLHGLPLADVARITSESARRLFRLRDAGG